MSNFDTKQMQERFIQKGNEKQQAQWKKDLQELEAKIQSNRTTLEESLSQQSTLLAEKGRLLEGKTRTKEQEGTLIKIEAALAVLKTRIKDANDIINLNTPKADTLKAALAVKETKDAQTDPATSEVPQEINKTPTGAEFSATEFSSEVESRARSIISQLTEQFSDDNFNLNVIATNVEGFTKSLASDMEGIDSYINMTFDGLSDAGKDKLKSEMKHIMDDMDKAFQKLSSKFNSLAPENVQAVTTRFNTISSILKKNPHLS